MARAVEELCALAARQGQMAAAVEELRAFAAGQGPMAWAVEELRAFASPARQPEAARPAEGRRGRRVARGGIACVAR